MKKRLCAVFVAVATLLGCTASAAGNNNLFEQMNQIDWKVNIVMSDEKKIERYVEQKNLEQVLQQTLAPDEVEKLMEKYSRMIVLYQLNSEDINNIMELVEHGADLSKLIDIYTFLQDSNASTSYAEKMYEIGEKVNFYGRYWVEDAFNFCAGQQDNALEMHEIKGYLDLGLNMDDIRTANVVARKQGQSPGQLLDQIASGIPWGEVISQQYQQQDLAFISEETNGSTVLQCIRLSKQSALPPEQVYEDYKQDPQTTTKNIIMPKIEKVNDYLQQKGLNITDTPEYLENLKIKFNNVLTEKEIENLISQHYTEKEIERAIEINQKTEEISIEEILQMHDLFNCWYDEMSQGGEVHE
jgi:hypothetical protein